MRIIVVVILLEEGMRRSPIKGAGAELTHIDTLKWGEKKKTKQKSILNDSSESQKMTAAQIDGGGEAEEEGRK